MEFRSISGLAPVASGLEPALSRVEWARGLPVRMGTPCELAVSHTRLVHSPLAVTRERRLVATDQSPRTMLAVNSQDQASSSRRSTVGRMPPFR